MILVLSSSSKLPSVALFESLGSSGGEWVREFGFDGFSRGGRLLGLRRGEVVQGQAAETLIRFTDELLQEHAVKLEDIEIFVADVGPGSFVGVRVGVMLAKTWAYSSGKKVASISAFDLINPTGSAQIPNRKGEFFVRSVGEVAVLVQGDGPQDVVGYGVGIESPAYPNAENALTFLNKLDVCPPEQLILNYQAEASISTPKIPYRQATHL